MIRVTIELLPHGKDAGKKVLGVLDIANDGSGTDEIGNYSGELHAEYTKPGDPRRNRVLGFNRKRKSVWTLVGMFLKKFGHT